MLLDEIKKYKIYLASQSPRRQKLLEQMGLNFNIATKVDVDESYPSSLHAEEIAVYLSEKKSDAYSFILQENRLLITADTIVWCEDDVLGKPASLSEAEEMLNLLSGRMHEVITGITLRTANKKHSFSCTSKVWFRELEETEISYYVNNFKPLDKAGAYGIQEWIGMIAIEKIEGSYYNVVGLPTVKLFTELEKFIKK